MSRETFDIVVVGGGSAGIAAAIGAARRGARVSLIERDATIGGNATTAMVGTVCGLARCGASAPRRPSFDNPGFAAEFSRKLAAASGSSLVINDNDLAYLPYRPSAFEEVAHYFLKSEKAISFTSNAAVTSASRAGERGDFCLTLTKGDGSTTDITTHAVIDTTGDAALLSLLNIPTTEPHPRQAAALVFELAGLPPLDEKSIGFTIRKAVREAVIENSLPEHLSYISLVPGSLSNDTASFKLGTEGPDSDAMRLTIERAATEGIARIISCLQRRVPEFVPVHTRSVAPRLGVRSGRRGIGEDTLTEEAVRLSQRHINGIAVGLWPAEAWSSPARPSITFPEQGNAYEIPLGSLCARGIPGVYFAGRMLSASDYAHASARVIGTCLSTGYAAGRIAAGELHGESVSTMVEHLRAEQVEPFHRITT